MDTKKLTVAAAIAATCLTVSPSANADLLNIISSSTIAPQWSTLGTVTLTQNGVNESGCKCVVDGRRAIR